MFFLNQEVSFSILDNDGDTSSEPTLGNWFLYEISPHSGAYSAASASYVNYIGPLTPDNWLISPAISLSGGEELHFWAAAQDPSWSNEHYSVYLSVSGTELSDFTVPLFEETLSGYAWHEVVVVLGAFAGETVHLAWRHHNVTDMFIMKIDDIQITSGGGVTIFEESFELNNMASDKKGIGFPLLFSLHHNYPNPFNPLTTIRYELPVKSQVMLSVYDIQGREINTLVSATQEPGFKSVIWDATDHFGKSVSAGVYLYQIQTGNFVQTRKMILLK